MKNLNDLNEALFKEIQRVQDAKVSGDKLEEEIHRAQAVTHIAKTIISNGELQLRTIQHLNEYGYGQRNDKDLAAVPALLDGKNDET